MRTEIEIQEAITREQFTSYVTGRLLTPGSLKYFIFMSEHFVKMKGFMDEMIELKQAEQIVQN